MSAPAGRLPDFFIAGHPKCGTTALYLMLRRHPQIFMSALKEPQYFAPEMRAGAPPSSKLPDTLDAYKALFAGAQPDQRAGEASPSYLRSHTAAEAIAELQPSARIIALVREPASFLRSIHLQFVQAFIESEHDLRKALELEDARRRGQHLPPNGRWAQALMYSEHVRYVEQLRRYRAAFSAKQMLVLIYDDLRNDNERVARQVLRFLEVDDSLPITMIEANPTVQVRARRIHRLTRSVHLAQGPAARTFKRAVNTVLPRELRQSLARPLRSRFQRQVMYAEPTPPDPQLALELRRRYRGEVLALSEYLDRDLIALWGYDALD